MKTITYQQALRVTHSWDIASFIKYKTCYKSLEAIATENTISYEVYNHEISDSLVYKGCDLEKAVIAYNEI